MIFDYLLSFISLWYSVNPLWTSVSVLKKFTQRDTEETQRDTEKNKQYFLILRRRIKNIQEYKKNYL